MRSLRGIGVLVTRPGQAGRALAEAILSLEGNAIYYPTLEIFAVPSDPVEADLAVFTSQYSAIHAPAGLRYTTGIAIGPGTAAACQSHGWPLALRAPPGSTSEDLLELPLLQSVASQHIVIVTGIGGRRFLETPLRQRGAKVSLLPVYRREITTAPAYPEIWDAHVQVVICTSAESFAALQQNLGPQAHAWLARRYILTTSVRVQRLLQAQSFTKILLAKSAQTSDILACLQVGIL